MAAVVCALLPRCFFAEEKVQAHFVETLPMPPVLPSELPRSLKLHMFETCPFCARSTLVLGWLNVPYERVLYGFGEGATLEEKGYNPNGGPIALTGKKKLPVLEGPGVPCPEGMRGLPESMEICSYIGACVGRLPPATLREDLADWLKRFTPVMHKLCRPRLIKMPVKDFADKRDVEFYVEKFTKTGFDFPGAEAATAELRDEMAPLLAELDNMLRGRSREGVPCLNAWGLGMDDVLVLPFLRNLTAVRDLVWPPLTKEYLEKATAKAGVELFMAHAC